MIRLTTRSTRTATLCPDSTLVRLQFDGDCSRAARIAGCHKDGAIDPCGAQRQRGSHSVPARRRRTILDHGLDQAGHRGSLNPLHHGTIRPPRYVAVAAHAVDEHRDQYDHDAEASTTNSHLVHL